MGLIQSTTAATVSAEHQVAAIRALEESLRAALEQCGVHRELARERRRQDHRGPRVPFTGFPPYQFGGDPTIPDWYGYFSQGWGYFRGPTAGRGGRR